ncbi:hypothetical protein AB0K09_27305 [Streptomyces sp. NPDC049577]|uniref:hypothetical protein n=1 Tax=Streptomyces sp. NPDC049577 TaxID=3155153 RepID=UPI00343DBF16
MIPLRPLGVGEIIEGAVNTLRTHWRPALGVSLSVALATQAVTTLATTLWLKDGAELDGKMADTASVDLHELLGTIRDSAGTLGLGTFLGLLGWIFAAGMLTVVVSRAVLGRSITAREAWRDTRPRLLPMAGLVGLVTLLMLGMCAVAVAPGLLVMVAGAHALGVSLTAVGGLAGAAGMIWLWIRYSLAAPALMLEKQGIREALARSVKLTTPVWWRIFGIQMLATALVFVVQMILQIPLNIIELILTGKSGSSPVIAAVGGVLATTISLPVTAGVTALLYMDQRIRRESLDLELARAAGV